MRRELFAPTPESEARLLLLISAFSKGTSEGVQGRTKLAKLDFLLRYPAYFERAINARASSASRPSTSFDSENIETPMVRYRYGPWDPAYFALLGALIGRRLVAVAPGAHGLVYRATDAGRALADEIAGTDVWRETAERAVLLKRYFDLSGANLKKFVYEHFPEIVRTRWGESL